MHHLRVWNLFSIDFEVISWDLLLPLNETSFKFQGIFKEYDADESGTLSTMELRSALAAAGYRVNFKILNALVLRYGNKQGSLSFDDYLMCAIKLKNMIGK